MKRILSYNSYIESINEDRIDDSTSELPTYEECIEMCNREDSPFYESKFVIENYPISAFNYRLAKSSDFLTSKSREMRGICFVFNEDGTLFKRYVLLEKFFNLDQVPGSMYSDVKDYKIVQINNKEDGSIASFVRLPNGKAIGKSKMGFDNDQANGINRIYRTNSDIKRFVDSMLDLDIVAVFEYVSAANRIVLRYTKEELILLRLRDNKTGRHLNIKDYLDQLGSIRIAPFEDENSLDELIEKSKTETGREGWVITFLNGQMIKIKTTEYQSLHGLLTNDLYREHILIGYILDDKIDDILCQIPEDEVEARERIDKMISIVKLAINDKVASINKSYQQFLSMGSSRKDYALSYRKKDPNFGYVMSKSTGSDVFELAKDYIREKTKRLNIAREWLKEKDPTLFFKESNEEES